MNVCIGLKLLKCKDKNKSKGKQKGHERLPASINTNICLSQTSRALAAQLSELSFLSYRKKEVSCANKLI